MDKADERIRKVLRDAQKTVRPIIERERKGEVPTAQIMQMRFK